MHSWSATHWDPIMTDTAIPTSSACRSNGRSRSSNRSSNGSEEGKVPLEESVAIYERGEALKRRCEELLRQAEARVEKITLDAAGKPTGTEPLDVP